MRTPEVRAGKKHIDWITLAIILSVAVVLAYTYYRSVDRPNLEPRLELHDEIVHASAESPYRYRVLVPIICEGLRRALGPVLPGNEAFLLTYALYDVVAVFFLLGALFMYLRAWFSRDQALVGVLFAAATMPVALRDHYFQPWSPLEAGFLAAGLLCIYRRRHWTLALITALASLNRETAIFIPLAFLFANASLGRNGALDRMAARKTVLLFGGYCAVWAVIFFGLRAVLGGAPQVITLGEIFSRNTAPPATIRALMRGGMLFGAFWVFAVAGFRRAPAFIQRVSLVALPYLAAVLVWGIWHEARLLLPFEAIVIPLGLSFIYLDQRPAPASAP